MEKDTRLKVQTLLRWSRLRRPRGGMPAHLSVVYPGIAVDLAVLLRGVGIKRLVALIDDLANDIPELRALLMHRWCDGCTTGPEARGGARRVSVGGASAYVREAHLKREPTIDISGRLPPVGVSQYRLRAQNVLRMLGAGLSTSAVAQSLGITPGRVSQIKSEAAACARGASSSSAPLLEQCSARGFQGSADAPVHAHCGPLRLRANESNRSRSTRAR